MSIQWTIRRLSKGMAAPKCGAIKPGASPSTLSITVDDKDTCTVFGIDQFGNDVDISALAKIAVSSDNTTLMTIDSPVGMSFTLHCPGGTGTANATATVTWNDGSIGPFTGTLAVTIAAGKVTGVTIVPGPPQPGP